MKHPLPRKSLFLVTIAFSIGCDSGSADNDTETGTETGAVLDTDTATSEGDSDEDTSDELFKQVFEEKVDDEAKDFFDPTHVVDIRLTLPPDAWEELKEKAEDEIYVPADAAIDGEDIGEVGLRFKGSYGSLHFCFEDGELVCPKLPMKIKFNKYDDEKRYKGLKRINLHTSKWDASMLREYFAYSIYREMGIPTSRVGYAQVQVNDELLGVFVLVEQLDGRFVRSRFKEGDGNLYKEVRLDHTDDGALNEALRTNKDSADHSAFRAYAADMTNADDDTRVETLSKWMSLEYLMRYMAVDDAIYNWDGITAIYCGESWGCLNHNFLLYQEEKKDRFWLIPWDLDATTDAFNWNGIKPWTDLSLDCDSTYTSPNSEDTLLKPPCGDPVLRAMALYFQSSDVYEKAVRELLDSVLDLDAFNEKIDSIAENVEQYIDADPDREVSTWKNSLRGMKENLMLLRNDTEHRLRAITEAD